MSTGRARLSSGFADGPAGNALASLIPQLVFITQPSASVVTGVALTQPPRIQLQDQLGNPLTQAGWLISFPSPTPITYTPNPLRTDANGIAAVSTMVISAPPAVYLIQASADGIPNSFSSAVNVTAPQQGPTAIIAAPLPNFTVQVGTGVTLNPQGSFAPGTDAWSAHWTVFGAGNVVRFDFVGGTTLASNTTIWTPTIAEAVTIRLIITDVVTLLQSTISITGGVVTQTATQISVSPASFTLATGGQSQILTATVLDSASNPVQGATVTWSDNNGIVSLNPLSSVTNTAGQASTTVTSGSSTGTSIITATV